MLNQLSKILMPLDFTERSISHIADVLSLAKRTGSSVLFFHAYSRPTPTKEEPGDAQRMLEDRIKQIDRQFTALKKKHPALAEKNIRFVRRVGRSVSLICELVVEEKIDLVVMPTKGSHGINQIWGSKTYQVVEDTSVPVLILPAGSQLADINTIGMALDMNNQPEASTLHPLRILAECYKVPVKLFSITEPQKGQDNKVLNPSIGRVLANTDFNHEVYPHSEVAEGILHYSRQQNLSMVSVLPTSRSFFEGLFHNSVTKDMAYKIDLPLLVLKKQRSTDEDELVD